MKDIERKDTNDVSGGVSIVDPYGLPPPTSDPFPLPPNYPNPDDPICPTAGTGPIS